MTDQTVAALYASERVHLLGLLAETDAAGWATPVAATPPWTVRDVAAHLTGICLDVPAGRVEGAPGPDWTAAQVHSRADAAPAEILAEWDQGLPAFLALMDSLGSGGANLTYDIVMHHGDVREALGASAGTHTEAYAYVREGLLVAGSKAVHKGGLPTLRVLLDCREVTFGRGEPAGTLTVDAHELVRAISGRRSLAAMRAWAWDGVDPEPYLLALPVFPAPPD